MATLGPFDTSNKYIKYKIMVTQNSQSVVNNTSNVTVKVFCYRTNTGYTTYGSGTVYCKINGTAYTASIDSSDKITNSGIYLFSKTLNISHNSDGTKSLAVYAKISHSQFDQTSYKGSSVTLTTIPRKSTLSVSNGTLGKSQTLTITRKSSSFKHRIYYSCGTASGYIPDSNLTSETSISWTPPLDLASQNTTGTSLSVKIDLGTYTSDGTKIGTNSYTITIAIPDSIKPSCSISVSDAMGYASTYGGYIKGLSKMKVDVSASPAYGSAIASYSVTANGGTYTSSSFTTGVITSSGTLTAAAKVTDKRGRTGASYITINVLDYSKPVISKLIVGRCDSDGTANDKGEYVKVTYAASVTSLNGKNTSKFVLKYKKSSASDYVSVNLSSGSGSYIFAAESGSSYDVVLSASDNFSTTTKSTTASTGFTLMHFSKGGTGLGIGKIAEEENLLDVGIPARFRGGIKSDKNWIDLVLNSSFNLYANAEANRPRYKENCGIVTVKGAVSPKTEFTSNYDLVNIASGIPSELRPSENLQFICQGSTMNRWNLTVRTDGSIAMSRYGITGLETVSTSAWLVFCVTYQV